MKEDEMTKPIMSIKILEDFATYTNAADDWITEYVPEAWEAREVLDYIAELESLVDELKPYRDGYDPEEVFPPEDEWVWLRDCDDNIEPVQYDPKSGWYWNYERYWMPDNGDIRRWYPIGTLPEVQE